MADTRTIIDDNHSVVDNAIQQFSSTEFDYQYNQDAKTIGEYFLHIGAFEFLFLSAIAIQKSISIDTGLWMDLKPGFAQDVGWAGITGLGKAGYIARVNDLNSYALSIVASNESFPVSTLNIAPVISQLKQFDSAEDPNKYDDLETAAVASARDILHAIAGDMGLMFISHCAYHRGMAFLSRWISTQP